ncbi:MAG TPA: glycoside hydrolase family 3 C-terminal domain-containing protein [Terriglobales bacterium]
MSGKLRFRFSIFSVFAIAILLPANFLYLAAQEPAPSSAEVAQRVDKLLKQLTLEEKIDLIGGVDDFYIRANAKIGLPRLKMADGPFGVRNYGPSTTFGGLGLAATWDPEMARRMGRVVGQDARARGVHFMLGPGVNIYRAPMNGRNFEYFGEDPFLASRTAVGYIEGMQSEGVSATIKHFMGNNQEYDRHNMDSIIDERTMREIYLPVFEAAVKEAHVGAIMDSYNLTNGRHMTQNGYLNTDVAKQEWGFDGIIMSDWDATYDGVAAANGGLDLEMPSGKFMNRATLLPAVKAGKVSESTIDDKVRRILRKAVQFGWLDRDQTDLSIPLMNPEGKQVALEAARSGMVLLKNQGNVLPLDKTRIKSIAVIGPDAYPGQPVGGGSAGVQPFVAISYLQGLSDYLGNKAKVYYQRGIPTLAEMAEATPLSVDDAGRQAGVKAEFFNNLNLAGNPLVTRTERHINGANAFGRGVPGSNLSARWTGYFTPKAAGDHTVFIQGPGEGGSYRLFIDGKKVIDHWGNRALALVAEANVPLSAGPHKVALEYSARDQWGGPSLTLGIVRPQDMIEADAKQLASRADAVVLAVGFDPSSESEGSDRTFQLPPVQDELVSEIADANKNTVVAITSGGGIAMPWIERVPAIFECWYAGQEAGTALAELLFGDYSPSGKLPISIEKRWQDNAVHDSYYPKDEEKKVEYKEGVFLGYRHFDKTGIKPLFPFGFGLSYTTFALKNLSVSPGTVSGDQPVTVSFDVTNTGNRAGADVAEVYVGETNPPLPRPVKELKGFSKITLNPGETRHVSVELDRRAFAYYNTPKHEWTADAGEFKIWVGDSAEQIELSGKVTRQ